MSSQTILAKRYQVIRSLGKGAEGETFLAQDQAHDGVWVALKLLSLQGRAGDVQAAFDRECRLLSELNHPHLARLLDFGQWRGQPFLVTPYVEGSDLVREARERDWNAVFVLMVQAAWALEYLHQHGVWHRDIKPANLLVGMVYDETAIAERDRLRLQLIDFGAAVRGALGIQSFSRAGTLPYMAPEVLSGAPYDHRADLYSLGIVFYEMSLGRLPFAKTKGFQKYLRQLTEGQVDLNPLMEAATPKGVLEVLSRMVQRNPQDRMDSALEIIQVLNEMEGEAFPKSPEILGSSYQQKTVMEATKLERPAQVESPAQLLASVKGLSRQGKKQEAWERLAPDLESSRQWSDPLLQEELWTQAVHLLAEQGRYQEAWQWRQVLGERQPPPLEFFLTGAYLHYRQGQLEQAAQILEQVPPDLLAQQAPDKKSRWANEWGLILAGKKQWTEAAAQFEEAAKWAERSGRQDHRVSFLTNAGGLYFKQNRWRQALACYLQALELARAIGNEALMASIQNNLGNLYLYFGRWNEAEAALQESLQLAQQQELKPLVAYNLYLLTHVEEGRGNKERVEEYLEHSLSFAEQLGDAQPILQARLAQAYWQLTLSQWEAALQSVEDLEQRAQADGFQSYLVEAQYLRAKIQLAQGRWQDPAVAQGLQAYRAALSGGDFPLKQWPLLVDEGDWAKAGGKLREAKEKYQKALNLLKELQQQVPEAYQESFFRDRKKEKLLAALKALGESSKISTEGTSQEDDMKDNGDWRQWAQVNRRILLQHRMEPMLEEILDAALELTGAERGFVILKEAEELVVKAARNLDPNSLKKEEGRFSYTVAQEVMRQGGSQVVLDVPGEETYAEAESVVALGIRSLLCVPLKTQLGTVGLIYLDNRFREGAFNHQHLPRLEAFADQASLALEHARLFQENERTIQQLEESKSLIERLNQQLEKDLIQTSESLKATQEGMRRQNEELALRYTYEHIIGQSSAIKKVLKSLDRIVASDINVFIYGESGTGKELIAQAIHFNSPRKSKAFIAENCTALPENLLESELFGHVKGAFTGADQDKVGLFTMADGGTLFLDEVGDMPLNLQAKLLRVIQEGTVRPLGSNRYHQVDVRVVSASNKDLKSLVKEKLFRQDLFFRLNVMQINLPPLRERTEDIPELAQHFIGLASKQEGRESFQLPPGVLKILMDYPWPGNIRELQNEMRRLVALGQGGQVTPDLLSPQLLGESAHATNADPGLNPQVEELERSTIMKALSLHQGNKVKAARHLKIARRTLYLKMEQYGIEPRYGKNPGND